MATKPHCGAERNWLGWTMPARKPRDPNEKPQIERFREAARELGCEDDEEAFWDKVVRVAKHKPKDEPKQEGDSN